MAYTFPRDVLCELYFPSLGWTDVSNRLSETTPLSITWGQSGEQGKVAPSYATGAFKNDTGDFSPRNPQGEWFGELGRNTPIRLSLRTHRDTFGDNAVNSWGSADTGEAWTNTGNGSPAASDFQVTGGRGTQSVPATSTYRISKLAAVDVPNPQVRVTLESLGFTDVLGGAVEPANLVLRGHDSPSTDYYMARVTIQPDQSVTIGLLRFTSGVFFDGPVTVPGLTYTGQDLTVVLQVEDHWLGGKVYDSTAGGEPFDWQVEIGGWATDWLTGGYVGVRSGVASGNSNTKPIVFSYDNFEVRDVRFHGELSDLRPRWDESHRAKWVEFEAGGLLRRLERGNRPLGTTVRRVIEANQANLLSYWPLDEEPNSTEGRLLLGSGSSAQYSTSIGGTLPFPTISPINICGKGALAPWLTPSNEVKNPLLVVQMPTTLSGATTTWTAHIVVSFDGTYNFSGVSSDGLDVFTVLASSTTYASNPSDQWGITLDSGQTEAILLRPDGGTTTVDPDLLFNGEPHLLTLQVGQVGSDCQLTAYVDGAVLGTLTQTSLTNTNPTDSVFYSTGTNSKQRSIGHSVVYGGTGPDMGDLVDAIRGYVGETAGRRLERICGEEGIPFFSFGDLDDTVAMGPQYPDTLTEIIEECVRTELGLGYEPRGVFGFGFRTRFSLNNQDPTLSLDYSAGQVAPGLLPKHDDKDTGNYVTAKRRDGGEHTAIQETGPLNINNPWDDPEGVGVNDNQIEVNVETDTNLPSVSGWIKHLGTVVEDRYPSITVNFRASGITETKTIQALAVRPGDRVVVENLSAADIFDPVDQLVFGGTEVIFTDKRQHELAFNTSPASPYQTIVLDEDRLGSASSSLTSDIAAAPSSFQVTTTDPMDLWTTDAGSFPFDVVVGGQQMTISAISGTSSPQTFTVSDPSVNGVSRAWDAGTKVQIVNPKYLA